MNRLPIVILALGLLLPSGVGASTPEGDVDSLVAGNTAFGLGLYGVLADGADANANIVFSPFSVSVALAMAYLGADGETARQMAEVLGFGDLGDGVHPAFAALMADLASRGNTTPGSAAEREQLLRFANAFWGEQTYPFSPAYSADLERIYGAGLQLRDFANDPESVRQEINAWVAEQTRDRILDIVPPDGITRDTILAIANAIYFSGAWARAFEPKATRSDVFHRLDAPQVTVPFMVQREQLAYLRGDGFQAVELPYAGSGFAFTVILPDEDRFAEVERDLDANLLGAALGGLRSADVVIHLPKFEVTWGTVELSPALRALGMTAAFSDAADFSGMRSGGAGPAAPQLAEVFHKAFVAIDEASTEAAAATVITASPGAAPPPPEPPIDVRVDRPFLFLIRDTETGTVLFLGRVMDPSAA